MYKVAKESYVYSSVNIRTYVVNGIVTIHSILLRVHPSAHRYVRWRMEKSIWCVVREMVSRASIILALR